MKTAILISGHMRSFERCLPNQAWMVYRHFKDADFFVSTEPDEDGEKAELLDLRYPGRVKIDYTPQPTELEMVTEWFGGVPVWTADTHPSLHAPYSISVPVVAILGQLWRLRQCWSMVPADNDYQVILRVRPDLWFHEARMCFDMVFSFHALVPWWGRFGGCNDRFAVLGRKAAKSYFCTYDIIGRLVAMGCPLHPESLVKASVEHACGLVRPTLQVEFSTLRKDGKMRPPEITAGDIASFAANR